MANIDRPTFRLLQLPKKAQRNVCRVMEPLHQLGLSLCSKLTKSLVRSSGLKCETMRAWPGGFSLKFNPWQVIYMAVHENQPGQTHILTSYDRTNRQLTDNTTYKWTVPSFTTRDWAEHFLWVLNRRNMNYLACGARQLQFIRHNFVGINVDQLHVGPGSVEETMQFLKMFPCAKSYWIMETLPEVEFQKVLIQNLGVLKPTNTQKLILNDLLLCNSVHFECRNEDLTPDDLNRFVRLWMKGSTPRLRSIRVLYEFNDDVLDKEIILKGTRYQDQIEEKMFNLCEELNEVIVVSGGYEIKRMDGTKATIMIDEDQFDMYIWS